MSRLGGQDDVHRPGARELVRMGLESVVATLVLGAVLYGGYLVIIRLIRLLAGEA